MKRIGILMIAVTSVLVFYGCGGDSTEQEATDYADTPSVDSVTGEDTYGKEGPRMTFERTVYNFGEIKQGAIVKYPFVFTNTGDDTLLIKRAVTTCGCTTPKISKNVPILPGQADTLEVQFDTKHKSPREYTKVVTILCNIPDDTATVTIKATVIE